MVHGTAASIQRKHTDTASRRGKWALIRICGDNSRAATIKLRYVKLAATIRGQRQIEEIRIHHYVVHIMALIIIVITYLNLNNIVMLRQY